MYNLTVLTDVVEDVPEISLDDIYSMLQELSSDVAGLKSRISAVEDAITALQDMLADKLDLLLETLQNMPQYDQLQIIIAFLFMLVGFELMRLLRGWTGWFKKTGGSGNGNAD